MSFMSLLPGILDVAKAVAPLIVPGAGEAITAGQKVIELIDQAKQQATNPADIAELDATRDDLERRVNAHADSVAEKLKGD